MNFKSYLNDKKEELYESDNGEFSKLRFKYIVSDKLQEMLNYYVKEKGIDPRIVHNILSETSLITEDLSYSEANSESLHEDLLDAGYVLGYIHSKRSGRIIRVQFEKIGYYYIGADAEILTHVSKELNKNIITNLNK